jgi:hypothetical protein
MSYDGVVRASTPTWYWATRETSGTTLAEDMASANATLSGSGYTLHQAGFAGSIIGIADSAGPYASGPAPRSRLPSWSRRSSRSTAARPAGSPRTLQPPTIPRTAAVWTSCWDCSRDRTHLHRQRRLHHQQ